jgi:hypothetical protein
MGASPHRPVVMPGLDPGIHSVALAQGSTVPEWIAGSSPAMTTSWERLYGRSGAPSPAPFASERGTLSRRGRGG